MPEEVIPSTISPTIETSPSTETSPPEGKPTDYSKLNVDFTDFQKLKGEHEEKDIPEVEDKSRVEKKVPELQDDKSRVEKEVPELQDDKNRSTPQIGKTVHARTGEGRDFTGIDPIHVDAFKRMSNDAFNIMKPIYVNAQKYQKDIEDRDRKIAELSTKGGQLPESYYDHPEGFILSQSFRQAQAEHQMAMTEAKHWEAQLIAVKSRKPVHDINLDEKNNLVIGESIDVDDDNAADLEVQILQHLTRANNMAQAKYGEMSSFAQNYKYKHEQLSNFVRELEDKFFPQYKDKNYSGWEHSKAIMNALPPELKSNIAAPFIGKMFGRMKELIARVKELEGNKAIVDKVRSETTLTDPGTANFNGGGKVKPKITYDMFQKL